MKGRVLKKLGSLSVMIFAIILLSGCVRADYHIKINWDGSADIDYLVGLDKSMQTMLGGNDPFADLRKNAEKEGYQISDYEDATYKGIRAKKHLDRLDRGSFSTLDDTIFQNNADIQVRFEKSFFTQTVDINEEIDLRTNGADQSGALFMGLLQSQADIQLRVTLPLKPKSHNATTVSADGKTLTWNMKIGENNPIQLNVIVPHLKNVLLVGIPVLIFFIILISYFWHRRNKKRQAERERKQFEEELEQEEAASWSNQDENS
jgi:hypothetical protein